MPTTTSSGAKKINNNDNWREIFDCHNDTCDAIDTLNSNLNNRTKVKEQSTNANSITDTCIIRTTSGSTNLPDSTNVEGILVSYISYLQGAYVGVQYFSAYATNKVYSRINWYGTWRTWVQLSN